MAASKKALIAAQMENWPASVILTPQEVIEWAHNNLTRANQVMMAIQYPQGVWYRIPHARGEYRGFRFGVDGPEYLSFA